MLFIDACPRDDGVSRTRQVAQAFLDAFDGPVDVVRLAQCGLAPYDGAMVDAREALIDQDALDAPMFAHARQFAGAQDILIAAPYWDLSFPALLKVYIEHIFARKIAFIYDEHGAVGLVKARRMAYITSSGSLIEMNLGGDYLRAVAGMLGIARFDQVSAEGLDIVGADVDAIIKRAGEDARALARDFASALRAGNA